MAAAPFCFPAVLLHGVRSQILVVHRGSSHWTQLLLLGTPHHYYGIPALDMPIMSFHCLGPVPIARLAVMVACNGHQYVPNIGGWDTIS